MERHNLHLLKGGSIGIGQATPDQIANVSNASNHPGKNGSTDQAKPKVQFLSSIGKAKLRLCTETIQFHSDILLLAYLSVELGNSGAVCETVFCLRS